VVEHSPQHPGVEGSSAAVAAGIDRGNGERKKFSQNCYRLKIFWKNFFLLAFSISMPVTAAGLEPSTL
jgi:hypothetical protein